MSTPYEPVRLTKKAQSTDDVALQEELKARGDLPVHIACIMDGNGRWAEARGKKRVSGHREGVESVRDITEACAQLGVRHLTLYTFSTENWNRPAAEVTALMELLVRTLRKEAERLNKNDIRLGVLGDLNRLPERGQREMLEAIDLTRDNSRMTLNLALSYSGRWELVQAVRKLSEQVRSGTLRSEEIDETTVSDVLETKALPDPDLLIRTGGEHRISNFLLWQIAYAELYFSNCFWPDFRREKLYAAIRDFQDRERRFGRVAQPDNDIHR
ncbi:MAG: isoprenyl transferase [Rubricoccaceae bacterium]|nr:isoprenyl transferase [Rubricoccaceae bacterium]